MDVFPSELANECKLTPNEVPTFPITTFTGGMETGLIRERDRFGTGDGRSIRLLYSNFQSSLVGE